MTENEVIRDLQYLIEEYGAYPPETGVSTTIGSLQYCISVLKEIQNYRKLGTLEELARANTYIKLAKLHGTVGEMIDICATYEDIGTVEECRGAVEKQKAKKPTPINYQDYVDKTNNAEFLKDSYLCPSCKTVLRSGSYCSRYGQKLCWDENMEGME